VGGGVLPTILFVYNKFIYPSQNKNNIWLSKLLEIIVEFFVLNEFYVEFLNFSLKALKLILGLKINIWHCNVEVGIQVQYSPISY